MAEGNTIVPVSQEDFNSKSVKVIYFNVPVGTTEDYHTTFAQLGLPRDAKIIGITQTNILSSVCDIYGYGISGDSIYFKLRSPVQVNYGQVALAYI